MAKPSGTVTFLLTDIVGSSRLWELHGDKMAPLLVGLFEDWTACVQSHQGTVFKTLGDGILAAFSSAPQALACTFELLEDLSNRSWPAGEPVQIRAALNSDIAVETEDDYFGPVINRLSRLLAEAPYGEVRMTAATKELCNDHLPADTRLVFLGSKRLRDIPGTVDIYACQKGTSPTPQSLAKCSVDIDSSVKFCGREREIEVIQSRLSGQFPVLTITGSGGMGKSRLAYEFSKAHGREFPDGTVLIDCSTVTSPDTLAMAFLTALDCSTDNGAQPQLSKVLKGKSILAVLDGFEHSLDCANDVARLVRENSGLRIIVTSRVLLGLSVESELALAPLNSAAGPVMNDAVSMFLGAAQRNSEPLPDDTETLALVAEVCTLVEGIPLLIRLAASRLRTCTLTELREQLLTSRLSLSTRDRDTPGKHGSVRRVIADSFAVLGKDPASTLREVSIFVGGFLASDVVAVHQTDKTTVLDNLELLREHSLVQNEGLFGATRFRLLDSVREFASEDMRLSDETRRRFMDHFAAVCADIVSLMSRGAWHEGHEQLVFRLGNLRQAAEHAFECSDSQTLGNIGPALTRVYLEAGLYQDFEALSARLLEHAKTSGDLGLKVKILGVQGAFFARNGRRNDARSTWQNRLEAARQLGHVDSILDAMIDLAGMSITDQDWSGAESRLVQAAQICSESEITSFRPTIEAAQAESALGRKDVQAALNHIQQAMEFIDVTPAEDSLYVLKIAGMVAEAASDWEVGCGHWRRFIEQGLAGQRPYIVLRGLLGLRSCLEQMNLVQESLLAKSAHDDLKAQLDTQVKPHFQTAASTEKEPAWKTKVKSLLVSST